MCNPLAFLITSAGMNAGSQIAGGITAKGNANLQAADMEYQAAVERDNAQQQATAIRRQGERDRGTTVTNIAASGVKIGDGSAADAERQVLQDAMTDERLAILRGDQTDRQLKARAAITRRAGRDALRAGYMGAATSLMSTYATYSAFSGAGGQYNYNGDASGARFSATGADVMARR